MTSYISRLAGVVVRRSEVHPREVVMRRGLALTTVVRTLADMSRRLPLVEGVVALDMALHLGLLDLADLRSWAGAHPRYPGIARLRKCIDLAEPATESVMETRLRLLLVLGGLPRPQAQVRLHDTDGHFIARPDLHYPGQRLALGYDGASHRESIVSDNRRQNRLMDAGYRLLHFAAADVLSTSCPLRIRQLRWCAVRSQHLVSRHEHLLQGHVSPWREAVGYRGFAA